MKKVLNFIKRMWGSKGPKPERFIFCAIYLSILAVVAPTFIKTIGRYKEQMITFAIILVCVLMLIKNIRQIFDRRTREKISQWFENITDRFDLWVAKILKKIIHSLGIDKWGKFGDEHDFVIRNRRSNRRNQKLINPFYWQEQENNEQRVRYIFIDFIIKKIREGYKVKPSKTPSLMETELAKEENEILLFESYISARYSGGREPIEDKTIDVLSEFIESKRRRK